jgi:3-vinyl bacteriochlorophyllide hydratase
MPRDQSSHSPLYTAEQRQRRDTSHWTLIQGILALKTTLLYIIMITGSIWEKAVFGQYLFAPAFYWEDVFSMLVLALHTAYLWSLWTGALSVHGLMFLALAAYATYVINAGQFILKLRAARLQSAANTAAPSHFAEMAT